MKSLPDRICSALLVLALLFVTLPLHRSQAQTPSRSLGSSTPIDQSTGSRSLPPTQQPAAPQADDDIVRITTNLVQIDVVVTDSKGNQVTDLKADDFELLEEGRPQKITNFSFVDSEPTESRAPANASNTTSPAVRAAEPPRRTIALVVDDIAMSFDSADHTRRAIRRFIEERMLPGDSIAVVRTSAGVGALQQFTSDKQHLYAAVERVRGKVYDTRDERLRKCQDNTFAGTLDPGANTYNEDSTDNEFTGFREEISYKGTVGAVNLIVRGLRELPGRKALVLFSDGPFACPNEQLKQESRFADRLKRISDLANRASVVFYSIDPRGLMALDSAADPGVGRRNSAGTLNRLSEARADIFYSQNAFRPVVEATGGLAIYNYNDIPNALQRVVDDQRGYYLLGYRPSETTFDSKKGPPRFNNLKVRLKRPGLRVRTRSGFYNYAETKGRVVGRTRGDQLLGALMSPFSSGAIDVRLTSLFGNEAAGSYMLSMLHIDPAGLTFTAQPDGAQQAVMDVLAITFDADGQIVEQVNKTQTMRASGSKLKQLMKNGLVYTLSVPITKPGSYQLRIAVRDAASERVGSAGQFIEVPDLGKHRLALSGIAVHESKPDVTNNPGAKPGVQALPGGQETTLSQPLAGPAMREFHQLSVLNYAYVIYNATATAGPPQLKTQISVSRDGQEVLAGELRNFDASGQSDLMRLQAAGRLLLGEALPPGEYVLKITVIDTLAKPPQGTATQSIDFEIVK